MVKMLGRSTLAKYFGAWNLVWPVYVQMIVQADSMDMVQFAGIALVDTG